MSSGLTEWVDFSELPELLTVAIGKEIKTRDPYTYGKATVAGVVQGENWVSLRCTNWQKYYTATRKPWRPVAEVPFLIVKEEIIGIAKVGPSKYYIAFTNCNGITFST